jgi:hypothetical protein
MARGLLGDSALHEKSDVVGILGKPVIELSYPAFQKAGFSVGDLQIPARDTHALVERERAGESSDGVVEKTAAIIENAEIVLSAGISRVDPLRKQPENRCFPLGKSGRFGVAH